MPDKYSKARRAQSVIDVFVSVFAAMMLWPFPVARATLSPTVHVTGVLLTIVVVQVVYFAVCAVVWRQTLGMRLAGIRLSTPAGEPATRRQALLWGIVSAPLALWFAVAPKQACSAAVAERVSATTVY